jgi:hypothetical protein
MLDRRFFGLDTEPGFLAGCGCQTTTAWKPSNVVMEDACCVVHMDEWLANLIAAVYAVCFAVVFCGLLLTRERRRTCTTWFRTGRADREFLSG